MVESKNVKISPNLGIACEINSSNGMRFVMKVKSIGGY